MKYQLSALVVCLLFLSYSTTEGTAAASVLHTAPMHLKITPECARILEYYIITQRIKQQPTDLKNIQIIEKGKPGQPIRVDLTSDQIPPSLLTKNIQIIEKGKPGEPIRVDWTSKELPSVLTKNIRIIERPGEQPIRVDLTGQELPSQLRIVEGSGEQPIRVDLTSDGRPSRNVRITEEGNTVVKLKPSGEDTDVVYVKGTGTTESTVTGIIPGILSETGRIAGEIVNTGGQLIKDDVNFKANLIGGALGGAGEAASNIIRETGRAAGDAIANIEEGVNNMLDF